MSIEIKSQTINLNQSAKFTFDKPVISNVVGVSYFSFTFGSKDHHVMKISLSIQTSWSDNVVQASVTAQMTDASGNLIDKGNSKVGLVCIANTESADYNLALASANGIANGGQSEPIPLPGASLKFAQPGISGFSLSHNGGDHHLRQILVGLGFTQSNTSGRITATAGMVDSSGHEAQYETADGVLIAGNSSEQGLLVAMLTNQQTSRSQTVTFSKDVTSAVVLMNSFTVTFGGDDHHVKTIGAGSTGWSIDTKDARNVEIDNAMAFVSDGSGHSQDSNASFVNLIVVGVPKA